VSGADNADYAGVANADLAAKMATAVGMTGMIGPVSTTISGGTADAFSGTMQSQSGKGPLDAKFLIVRLAPQAAVFVFVKALQGITPAQQSALDQAVAGVTLIYH
jgi:hypothetical protein